MVSSIEVEISCCWWTNCTEEGGKIGAGVFPPIIALRLCCESLGRGIALVGAARGPTQDAALEPERGWEPGGGAGRGGGAELG